jgi:signal transduction histidine kinase
VRGRLTLAFVGLAAVLLTVAGLVRAVTIADITRSSELVHLSDQARLVATVVDRRPVTGGPVTPAELDGLVPAETRLEVVRRGEAPVTVSGSGFAHGSLGDALRVSETVGDTTVRAVQSDEIVDRLTSDKLGSLAALVLGLVLLAGIAGFLLARAMAQPFSRLAEAAEALGRGRFDLDLPKSRVPEVAAIATALGSSAGRLQESIRRDREFVQHASHVLRTPLTGLRLELEELTLRDDVDDEVRRTAAHSMSEVQRLDATIDELLDSARSRSLVAGAEVSVSDLGTHVAQHWQRALPASRPVRAFVDEGGELAVTPGPVEQLLDSVLRDVAEGGTGPVELRFAARDRHLRITVAGGPPPSSDGPRERISDGAARAIAEVLGGRYSGDATAGGLEIWLPRR